MKSIDFRKALSYSGGTEVRAVWRISGNAGNPILNCFRAIFAREHEIMFRNHVKPFVVACVTALVIAMLALAAFATKAGTTAAEPTIVRQGLTGTVTGSGHITVNGQVAQSGARITNGSVITTDADADALVDLGVLGQITLRPNTS